MLLHPSLFVVTRLSQEAHYSRSGRSCKPLNRQTFLWKVAYLPQQSSQPSFSNIVSVLRTNRIRQTTVPIGSPPRNHSEVD